MPPKKKTETTPATPAVNLDELLTPAVPAQVEEVQEGSAVPASVEAVQESSAVETKAEETESFEQAELAALRAELEKAKEEIALAQTNPTDAYGKPLPEEELTPEQREIRNLQDQLARTRGKNLESLEEEEEFPEDGILIHILVDGFTANGKTFYRGQEIVFGERAYAETKDRNGKSWLDLDDDAQYDLWDDVKFRKGEWPGKKTYEDSAASGKSIRSTATITRI